MGLSKFKPVTFPEPSFFMFVLGREGNPWDEISMRRDKLELVN